MCKHFQNCSYYKYLEREKGRKMRKSNFSAFEGRDQMDVTEVIDKLFCSIRLVRNDSPNFESYSTPVE